MPRRAMLRSAAVAGTAATLSLVPATASAAPNRWTPEELKDRKRVLEAGFTEAEADCWLLVVRATAAFFALPELHPLAKPEVVTAVHVIQDKLMMRPAYRKYRAANP
ncbi:hypothetical protein GCM10022247_38530 [Allokutzneria multivorans]|uniref:Twin-arginine translocation signal domain-containing protein n=2 Tax=Allokutzneria multivorans TaxID=1142134 RepID=A0ABP7SIH6_9PSEU